MADTEPKSCSIGACGLTWRCGAGRLETEADCSDADINAGKKKSGGEDRLEGGLKSGKAGCVVCGGLK